MASKAKKARKRPSKPTVPPTAVAASLIDRIPDDGIFLSDLSKLSGLPSREVLESLLDARKHGAGVDFVLVDDAVLMKRAAEKGRDRNQRDELPATEAARANVVLNNVERHRRGDKRAKRLPLYETWYKRGLLTKPQAKAAQAILNAYERRTATGGQAINPTKVDSSPNPHASAERLLRVCRGRDPMDLVPIKYRQAVSLVVVSNVPCGRDRMEALRRGLDLVSEWI